MTATQEAINKVNSAFDRSVVLSHPGCGPFVQHAARGLHEAGLLAEYVNTFHYDDRSAMGRFLKLALRARYEDPEKQLAWRRITEIPLNLVTDILCQRCFACSPSRRGLLLLISSGNKRKSGSIGLSPGVIWRGRLPFTDMSTRAWNHLSRNELAEAYV